MKNFNKGERFGGKKRFDSDRGFKGGGRSGRPEMHKAICADCGKECEVPFRPSGDKPVFCSNCFGKKEGGGNNRFERRDSGRPSFGDKLMFKAVCSKCHKECEVPFRPSGDKPVFCADCFGKERDGGGNAANPDKYQKQFDMLNNKLDNILKILAPQTLIVKTIKPESVVKKMEKVAEKKVEVKKVVASKKVVLSKKAVDKVAAKKKKK
jgi:CxxC-x17-CxxC domain-containing protein